MKKCKLCLLEKELESFYKSSRHKDGRFSHCKECHYKKLSKWPSQSKEKSAERVKAWKEKNKEAVRSRERERAREAYRSLTPEQRSQIYLAKKNYLKEYKDRLTPEQREKYKRTASEWAKNNIEKVSHRSARYRARRANAEGSHTLQDWLALCDYYGWMCLACLSTEKSLTQDHIKPLSAGGSDNIDNIQPLCQSCNSSKGVNEIDYRKRGT